MLLNAVKCPKIPINQIQTCNDNQLQCNTVTKIPIAPANSPSNHPR